MSKIALISCTSKKENHRCPAVKLYSKSPTFRLAYTYAEMIADEIYILSAKHGLLSTDEIIEPYDETLIGESKEHKQAWSNQVLTQLGKKVSLEQDEFIILAGQDYYEYLTPAFKYYWLPLKGKRQGERQPELKRLIALEQETNLCKAVHLFFNMLPRLDYRMISQIPFDNGIYIMFEKGQKYGELDRIVRVGTHIAEGRLKTRLKNHFLTENKDGSIFRKNIGKALLNKNRDPYLNIWTLDTSNRENAKEADKDREKEIETKVSDYLQQNITFVCFPVEEKEDRLRLEESIISLLNKSMDFQADDNWLGKYSPVEKIKQSGLWLTQGLDRQPLTTQDFNSIKDWVRFIQFSLPHTDTISKDFPKIVVSKKENKKTGNKSVAEVRKYIMDLLQQKKAEGEKTYTLRAGDLQKELGLINATPTVCDAMTKKIGYEYEIVFAPPKGKSTSLTLKYLL